MKASTYWWYLLREFNLPCMTQSEHKLMALDDSSAKTALVVFILFCTGLGFGGGEIDTTLRGHNSRFDTTCVSRSRHCGKPHQPIAAAGEAMYPPSKLMNTSEPGDCLWTPATVSAKPLNSF